MKKNGFTLVELLAMLTVIGIIMVVAIPNISGMLRNQRLNQIKHDANSMIESAKMKVSKNKLSAKLGSGECMVFSLYYLDENENIVKGPNGGNYDLFDSVVVVTKVDTPESKRYDYHIRLVENTNGKRVGFELKDSTEIDSLRVNDIKEIKDNIGLTKETDKETGKELISNFASITAVCKLNPTIKDYYSGTE